MRLVVGKQVRVVIVDEHFGEIVIGEGPVWMGLDLASGPEMVEVRSVPVASPSLSPSSAVKRSHPTTARELRRAERRRGRGQRRG